MLIQCLKVCINILHHDFLFFTLVNMKVAAICLVIFGKLTLKGLFTKFNHKLCWNHGPRIQDPFPLFKLNQFRTIQ